MDLVFKAISTYGAGGSALICLLCMALMWMSKGRLKDLQKDKRDLLGELKICQKDCEKSYLFIARIASVSKLPPEIQNEIRDYLK